MQPTEARHIASVFADIPYSRFVTTVLTRIGTMVLDMVEFAEDDVLIGRRIMRNARSTRISRRRHYEVGNANAMEAK